MVGSKSSFPRSPRQRGTSTGAREAVHPKLGVQNRRDPAGGLTNALEDFRGSFGPRRPASHPAVPCRTIAERPSQSLPTRGRGLNAPTGLALRAYSGSFLLVDVLLRVRDNGAVKARDSDELQSLVSALAVPENREGLLRLVQSDEDRAHRALRVVFTWAPETIFNVLSPLLRDDVYRTESGVQAAKRVCERLSGQASASEDRIDPRRKRLRSEHSMWERQEELETEAFATARRAWVGDRRWVRLVASRAPDESIWCDSFLRLVGAASLELPDEEAWRLLDPILSSRLKPSRALPDGLLDSLLRNPRSLDPTNVSTYERRLASPIYLERLMVLSDSKLKPNTDALVRLGIGFALRRPNEERTATLEFLLQKGGAWAQWLLDELEGDKGDSILSEGKIPHALSSLARSGGKALRESATFALEKVVVRILELPAEDAWMRLNRNLCETGPTVQTLSGFVLEQLKNKPARESEAYLSREPRLLDLLLPAASRHPDKAPMAALVRALLTQSSGRVLELLAPWTEPTPKNLAGFLNSLCMELNLICVEPETREFDGLCRVFSTESVCARWVLRWYIADKKDELLIHDLLPLAVRLCPLSAPELLSELEPLFAPDRLRSQAGVERLNHLITLLSSDRRLVDRCFIHAFASALEAARSRVGELGSAVDKLVVARDERVVVVLEEILRRGMSWPDKLPSWLVAMKGSGLAHAIANALHKSPPTLLEGLQLALVAQGDESVIPKLKELAKKKGRVGEAAKRCIRGLSPESTP